MECAVLWPDEAKGFCEDRSSEYGRGDFCGVGLPEEGVDGEGESEPYGGAAEASGDDYPWDGGPSLKK